MQTQVFDTKPVLRPNQVEDAKNEIKAAEAKLQSPHIEDKGEVAKQLRRLKKSFEDQAPRPAENPDEEGRMVARVRQLENEILVGMPSQEEMRKAPPGAVDKHMKWEKRNKLKILEWKNLKLRLTHGEESEAANLEMHRPVGSSLNMDNAHIPGKMMFMPAYDAGLPVTFTDEQLAYLRAANPELAGMLATLNRDQRAEVKEVVKTAQQIAASEHGKRGVEKREASKGMSDEAKAAAGERMRKMHADKKAAKLAAAE